MKTKLDSKLAPILAQIAKEAVPKVKAFLQSSGLKENQDFTVDTSEKGGKHRINVKLNTGHPLPNYKTAIERQYINGTGLGLLVESASLFVRPKKIA
jgi:hypothetical protein